MLISNKGRINERNSEEESLFLVENLPTNTALTLLWFHGTVKNTERKEEKIGKTSHPAALLESHSQIFCPI